jgi:hypothetical protein
MRQVSLVGRASILLRSLQRAGIEALRSLFGVEAIVAPLLLAPCAVSSSLQVGELKHDKPRQLLHWLWLLGIPSLGSHLA